MGDPAGIGPEITVGAWRALHAEGPAFFVLADPELFSGSEVPTRAIAEPEEALSCFPDALPILPLALAAPARPGKPDPANAPSVIAAIERAVALTLAGRTAALVTNPISKSVLYAAGFPHPGHTEFLAALTGAATPIMMLASPMLRVVPVTVHLALRAALLSLTTAAIETAGRITAAALREDFALPSPRLAVAGLNPHAGEGGAMGDEEETLIVPAITALRAAGIDAFGPLPPDPMFTARARAGYDAALCMYHDQALIPLKTLDMDGGVNVTLGLSIIRTSPDHGTAFDIAGQGRADPASLIAALRLAATLRANRMRNR